MVSVLRQISSHGLLSPKCQRSEAPINGIDPLFNNLSAFYIGQVPVPAPILLEFISNGLLALKFSPHDQQMVQGGVLGVAILLDRVRARRFGRARR
jgi:ribose/xylose/arabinose/galactoside ABC-type transport system permease subunit